ncbi:MAG: DUF4249 domain-containing protein [Bacteroidota bacterium]
MRKSQLYIYSLSLLLLLNSCQRVIDVDISHGATLLVIEGNITNVTGTQTVSITKTVAYSDANVYPPVTGAAVTMTSTSGLVTFKETQPGQYTINNFKGRTAQVYQLNVVSDGKTYSAVSTLPTQVNLDSIGISGISVGKKTVKTVSVYYHDPPAIANQYYFVLYVNGQQVKRVFTINDSLSDGRIVNSTLYQDDITLTTGDKVEVEMQCIDKNVYSYWYSLSQQGGNGPTNSATPSNPISNFSNGALGYFSAHTVQRKSIIVL